MTSTPPLGDGAHAFVTSNGATLTYFVKGHGPRVLVNVAPGWGAASLLYQKTFGFLEADFTIVHLEPRGTRGSSFPSDLAEMSSWHMAEDVEALRLHLAADVLDGVTGHSNGAAIALWYAIRFPRALRRVILIDGHVIGSMDLFAAATAAIVDARPEKDAVAVFKRWDPMSFETDDDLTAGLQSILPLYLAKPERDRATFEQGLSHKLQAACTRYQYMAEGQHSDQGAQLGAVEAQTLVIVGREDFICPVPTSEFMANGIKNSQLAIIEDAGHLPWFEQQEAFAKSLREFYAATE